MAEMHEAPGGFWASLDERLGLSDLAYPVPRHANTLGYTLGRITVAGMLILAVTGVLMAQWYHPMAQEANLSVRFMMSQVPVARILRGIHYWTAQIVLISVGLHLVRVYATGSYRRPREANWLFGVALLAFTVLLYFTGTVLKWDQEAYEALAHNFGVGELVGGLGTWFSPNFASNIPMLPRLYIAHVSILPFLLFFFIGIHLLLIKKHGISELPPEWAKKRDADRGAAAHHTFAEHLRKLSGHGLALLGAATALAVFLPPGVVPAPVEGIEIAKPPWAYIWLYPLEDRWGLWALVVVPLILFAFLVLVPRLDRSQDRSLRRRRWLLATGGAIAARILVLLVMGYTAGPSAHVGM